VQVLGKAWHIMFALRGILAPDLVGPFVRWAWKPLFLDRSIRSNGGPGKDWGACRSLSEGGT
jgi:hypothetical protein